MTNQTIIKYKVSGIVPKKYKSEIGGGDSYTIKVFKEKTKAFQYAKVQSKNPKWWEVDIKSFNYDDELQGHWYFQNGILTMDMSL